LSVPTWDHTVDLLVAGSGAAAMAAGIRAADLGLSVLLSEKGSHYGGSTAMSGGVCWVGNHAHMAELGIADSDEEVLQYLQQITRGETQEALLRSYVSESKRMLCYLEQHTHVHFSPLGDYGDYYAEHPGGKPGGRSLEPVPFDGGRLGSDFQLLHRPAPSALVLGKFMITAREARKFIVLGLGSIVALAWSLARYALRFRQRRRFGRDPYLTNGNALVGRLRLSLKDRGVPIWLSAPLIDLVRDQGRVVGAVLERDGQQIRVRARKGVLLACGGFERNLQMRQEYGPAPAATEWTAGNEANTGDGILLARQLGAATALMDEAWWTPVTQYPGVQSGWVLVVEKSLPGGIFVDGNGRRFVNEAAPYQDVVAAMFANHARNGRGVPAWMVFDAHYRRNYIAGPIGPGRFMPDKTLPRRVRQQLLRKAPSLAELAGLLALDPQVLEATVSSYNRMAIAGRDEDFGRGEASSDRYYGDSRITPNPCMAPLSQPPFYAIPVYPGDLGTKGGLQIDRHARVLDQRGAPIAGLYAAGNTSASIMGRSYPGAGGTIGPALCFGFLAAEHAARELGVARVSVAPIAV
jgi:3-oxosteroid 1-dehydrogenase